MCEIHDLDPEAGTFLLRQILSSREGSAATQCIQVWAGPNEGPSRNQDRVQMRSAGQVYVPRVVVMTASLVLQGRAKLSPRIGASMPASAIGGEVTLMETHPLVELTVILTIRMSAAHENPGF